MFAVHTVIVSESDTLIKRLFDHCLYNLDWRGSQLTVIPLLIIPPLPITEAQLQEGFAVLDKALEITDKAVK